MASVKRPHKNSLSSTQGQHTSLHVPLLRYYVPLLRYYATQTQHIIHKLLQQGYNTPYRPTGYDISFINAGA